MKSIKILVFISISFIFSYYVYSAELVHQSYFETGSPNIDSNEKQILASNFKNINPNTVLWIIGYSDEYGSESHNIILSQKRADNIKKIIIQQTGLKENQIKALANGTDKANLSNILKRRVEIFNFTDEESKLTNNQESQKIESIVKDQATVSSDKDLTKNDRQVASDNIVVVSESSKSDKLAVSIDSLKKSVDELNKNLVNTKSADISLKPSNSILVEEKQLQSESYSAQKSLEESNSEIKSTTDLKSNSEVIKEVVTENKPDLEIDNKSPKITDNKAKPKSSNLEKNFFKITDYEIKVNYYSANQNADLDPVVDNNDLLSDPRLSIVLNTKTQLYENLSLITEIGLRWNEYSEASSSAIEEPWSGYGLHLAAGARQSINKKIDHSLKLGFDQILSHNEISPLLYELEMEPVLNLIYGMHFNFFENKIFNLQISPEAKLITGIDAIDTGIGYGLNIKSYFGKNRKYFINGNYNNDHYKIEKEKFNIETLELGFGIKF